MKNPPKLAAETICPKLRPSTHFIRGHESLLVTASLQQVANANVNLTLLANYFLVDLTLTHSKFNYPKLTQLKRPSTIFFAPEVKCLKAEIICSTWSREEIVCRSFIDIYIYNKGDKLPGKCIESKMADTNFFLHSLQNFQKCIRDSRVPLTLNEKNLSYSLSTKTKTFLVTLTR